MIRLAESGEVVTIDGLGVWPAAASAAVLPPRARRAHPGGPVADGHAGGTRGLDRRARALRHDELRRGGALAIRFAAEGFPVHPTMAEFVAKNVAEYARFPQNAALYLPGGRPVAVGDRFVQTELAATLQHMVDEEKAQAGRRAAAPGSRRRAPPSTRATSRKRSPPITARTAAGSTADDLAGYEVTLRAAGAHDLRRRRGLHLRPVVPGPAAGADPGDPGRHRSRAPWATTAHATSTSSPRR